jgi:hypothetical protein
MHGGRVEWRGDLFSADLEAIEARLRRLPIIPRPFRHTLTVFLHPDGERRMDLCTVIRLRAYRDLPEISVDAVASLLADGISGKLQAKARSGETRVLGMATVARRRVGAPAAWGLDTLGMTAGSIRVSERVHLSFAPGAAPPFGDAAERMRVTLDRDRHLFRLAPDGSVIALGQLGPRLEIKGPTQTIVQRQRHILDPEGSIRRRPNRSLELLFQDDLRRCVTPAPAGFPEMELKFDLQGGFDVGVAAACLAALGDVRLLLPPPHGIERMRRYHLCRGPDPGEEITVVETASGRLSTKRKRNARPLGRVLLRDTEASRTTDLTGERSPLDIYLRDRSLTRIATFEKEQTKIPLALPDGRAFLISLDHCVDRAGPVLDQIELEYIGTDGAASSSPDLVAADLEGLGARLSRGRIGRRLMAGACSKYGYFSAHAARVV